MLNEQMDTGFSHLEYYLINLLLKKNIIFEIKWTLWDFTKVNEKLLRWNFCGTIKINKVSLLLKLYLCEQCFQNFVTKFLAVVDFVDPVKTSRVKSNTKPCFDIDVLNAIRNRDKYFKKWKQSAEEIDKGNFKCAKFSLNPFMTDAPKLKHQNLITKT